MACGGWWVGGRRSHGTVRELHNRDERQADLGAGLLLGSAGSGGLEQRSVDTDLRMRPSELGLAEKTRMTRITAET